MREKKRVIAFAIEGVRVGEKDARLIINEAVFSFLGEQGTSRAAAKFVRWDEAAQNGFLKCNTPMLQDVIAALALKREFKGQKIAVRTLKLLGSIPPR